MCVNITSTFRAFYTKYVAHYQLTFRYLQLMATYQQQQFVNSRMYNVTIIFKSICLTAFY